MMKRKSGDLPAFVSGAFRGKEVQPHIFVCSLDYEVVFCYVG